MRELRRIIFWQPIDSPHQDAFLEAVAEQFDGELVLGVERPFPVKLARQGWRAPEHRLVKVVDIALPDNHAALASHSSSDSLHVFSGFFSHPLVWAGFRKLAASPARLAIYSEAPEQPPLTGWLKRLRGRLLAARWAGRFDFILAIGGVGREFFDAAGFPREKIVPFGYFLDVPPLPAEEPAVVARADGPFRFVSAGQLIHRKGIDLLVDACATLPTAGWQLDVYGDGPERAALERRAAGHGLRNRIAFQGTIPNADLQRTLAAADCVVLPSRFDGWGMLVSEALAAGTPVICTDRCGSADLVRAGDQREHRPCGRVARVTIDSLSAALARALVDGPPTVELRHRCHAAAVANSPSAAARRFLAAAAGTVPKPLAHCSPSFLVA